MIDTLIIFKKLDKNFNLKTTKYSNYEKISRIESEYRGFDWTYFDKKLYNKSLNSNIRVLNYCEERVVVTSFLSNYTYFTREKN
ncbi:hypothetical protein BpHYR1_041538 [Brachionus plicatilis]|uniref:Uncharacterized protein n=1 Tax=Brachionus plicatilis TaxID=10195 RepID=A0A3M7SHW5_BRAPC|nr:hypothetical protein BpHYR1_041538 [Brachionus plicatilis]